MSRRKNGRGDSDIMLEIKLIQQGVNMKCLSNKLKLVLVFWLLISASAFSQERGPEKGEITLASVPSETAIFNPVVQMTAFKRPVYCAQLPATCQD